MLKVIHRWLDLDPSVQFMAWIITFALMLGCGIGMIVGLLEYGMFTVLFTNNWILFGMISGFVAFFIYTVLFFVLVWQGKNSKSE